MYFPAAGVIISGALLIFRIPVIPTVMIPNPIAMILSIQRPTSNSPKSAISINAVGLAILAQANIAHEMMIYLRESQCNLSPCSRLSRICLRKINPESIARTVSAITPRSVLLSTKTRKAPIQLVSQKSNIIHPL